MEWCCAQCKPAIYPLTHDSKLGINMCIMCMRFCNCMFYCILMLWYLSWKVN